MSLEDIELSGKIFRVLIYFRRYLIFTNHITPYFLEMSIVEVVTDFRFT